MFFDLLCCLEPYPAKNAHKISAKYLFNVFFAKSSFRTRISGPPNAKIEQLTIAVDLIDTGGNAVRRVWHTYDLTELPSGGPKDITVRVPADGPVEGAPTQTSSQRQTGS